MSDLKYPVPASSATSPHEARLLVKKSRFVTRIAHAPDVDAAKAFVEDVRRVNADATHNCWAYVAGPPGSTAKIGYSDDGEPHGTAGRPMLTVLLHCGLGEIACVVTRHFGGIKLGTGGLVRAYQDSVSLCLEHLPVQDKTELVRLECRIAYADGDGVRRTLATHGARIVGERYDEAVTLVLELPREVATPCSAALAACTNGRAQIRPA